MTQKKRCFFLFAFFVVSFLGVKAQSLPVGQYFKYNDSEFKLVSHSVYSLINGEMLGEPSCTDGDIDTLNLFHDYEKEVFTFGVELDYIFKQKDSSNYLFTIRTQLGFSTHEHVRNTNYDGTVYPEWYNSQFKVNSNGPEFPFGLTGSIKYKIKQKFALKV